MNVPIVSLRKAGVRGCLRQKATVVLALIALLFSATPVLANEQAKRLVALLDYLGSDYKNAVYDGKIISASEYDEMMEFSKRSLELQTQLASTDGADKAGVEAIIKSLASHIAHKADAQVISDLAHDAKAKLIASYNIIPYPEAIPSFASGRQIFNENCAPCHGPTGRGDGPARQTINPKNPPPANFHDFERMAGLSPFKAFNVASFGVEGTAMPSFSALPEKQRWEVAFYVMSLRFSAEAAKVGAALAQSQKIPVELTHAPTLSTLSDEQLLKKLKRYAAQESNAYAMLAYLRRGLLEKESADPLAVARTRLREASELYAQGQKEKSYQKAIEAYLDGFEMAEPMLFAKDASFGRGLESQFTRFRNAIRQGAPAGEIQKRRLQIDIGLEEAARIMMRDEGFSLYYTFANSALIILREGLEAALILAAILAMLRVMGATQAIRYVHLGWVLALLAGLVTWLATETVLTVSGQHRESMEGFISVFAAVALFYVGYWLHTKSEAKKWQAFIREKVKDVVSAKKILGLVGISFFAVYREAFEVVLFYQALWLQNENDHMAVIWGLVIGSAALILATFAIFKLGLRIPLKYFFGATGTLLYFVAFIFAGNGIEELQAAGWVHSTPLGFAPQVPLLGIYPTLETLAAQVFMLMAFFATTFMMVRERQKAR